MNTTSVCRSLTWFALGLTCLSAPAAETDFHFEGGLLDGGLPANGTYDMTFELFDAEAVGTSAGIHTNAAVVVTAGVYEVLLPFPPAALDFNNRWIEVAARPEGSASDRSVLSPRTLLSVVPYASKSALSDGVVPGAIDATSLQAGAVTTEAINSGAVTLDKLSPAGSSEGQSIVRRGSALGWENLSFWSLAGNTGTVAGTDFLGTTDQQPLELRVNNLRSLLLVPTGVGANVIAGSPENVVGSGVAATIGGGWRNTVNASSGTVSGGQGNTAGGLASTVSGGGGNTAGGARSVVGGGNANTASGSAATVAGGNDNLASGASSFIGGGSSHRVIGSFGAIVAGQGNQITNDFGYVGGGGFNVAGAPYAVVGGGRSNAAVTLHSTVAGGDGNTGNGGYSVVGGGRQNQAGGTDATVGGGRNNVAGGSAATVGGGWLNEATGPYAVVPGGVNNEATGYASLAAGQSAEAVHAGTFVWSDNAGAAFRSTGENQFLIRAAGGVGIGLDQPEAALDVDGVIRSRSGGVQFPDGSTQLTAVSMDGWAVTEGVFEVEDSLPFAVRVGDLLGLRLEPNAVAPNFIAGSPENVVSNNLVASTIGGGWRNTVNGSAGTVAGGQGNTAGGIASTVSGGASNSANGGRSFVGGGLQNTATGAFATVVGGQLNSVSTAGASAFIGGGQRNSATAADAAIVGGGQNTASGVGTFVGGGSSNRVTGEFAVVVGGAMNVAAGANAALGGGSANQASGRNATLGGGEANVASGRQSTVGGGWQNVAAGQYGTVPGGLGNSAGGLASFAAGQSAKASHTGSFVWSDFSSASFESTGENQFLIRAAGGVGIGTASPQAALDVAGEVRSTLFTPTSDRNAKENFAPVDSREVLARVAALPITRWNFKDLPGAEHFGPMAQDFHAAFGLNGSDDRHIATVDADGVALAAIQGLNQKLEEKEMEIAGLKQRLERLEQLLDQRLK